MEVPYVKATNPKDIDPSNVGFQLPLDKTYVGLAATAPYMKLKKSQERIMMTCIIF
jgi:hypothetical protein